MWRTRGWTASVVAWASFIACTLALAFLAGCKRGREPIAAPVTPAAAVAGSNSAAPISNAATDLNAASEATAKPAAKNAADDAPPAPALTVAAPAFSTERIVVFVPGRPLLVDLQLTSDGQPHDAALDKLVNEVLELADADGDGRTTWKELCECPRVKYGQYGSLPIDNENSEKQIIERYDVARNGIVDRPELPRFLTRNAGGSRSFSLRGTLEHRNTNRRESATWRILDSDEDGVIAAAEWAASPVRLAGRDSDDDEILLAAELNRRLQDAGPDRGMYERRLKQPETARLLGPHADWIAVLSAFEQHYGGHRGLMPNSFPLAPELFAQLDQNHDGRINRNELAALNEFPADVVIAAEFGARGQESAGSSEESADGASDVQNTAGGRLQKQPRLKLVRVASSWVGSSAEVMEQPGRLVFSIGGLWLTMYTNDAVASDDFVARAKQALDMFDQNKDGYLEQSEVPESLQGQLGRFAAVDVDGDGKAYAYEIEAFLRQQQAGLRAQIHARAVDSEDLLFEALDANRDQRLDSREIESAPQRLAALDRSGDGQLTPDELPEVLVFALARGSLETPEATFAAPPPAASTPDEQTPRWFAGMDANADGVVSRREFVGTAAQFDQLDANQNSLIEPAEVQAALAK